MIPGFHATAISSDLTNSPAIRVIETMERMFEHQLVTRRNITLDVIPEGPTHIWVSMLHSNKRREGIASRVLETLTLLCEIHKVTIKLVAISLKERLKDGDGALDQTELEAYYTRRGFLPDDKSWQAFAMIRKPGNPATIARTSIPPKADPKDMRLIQAILGITQTKAA